jgi:hypothetical protein
MNKEISTAVILVNKNSRLIRRILNKTIDPAEVVKLQQAVLKRQLIPEY